MTLEDDLLKAIFGIEPKEDKMRSIEKWENKRFEIVRYLVDNHREFNAYEYLQMLDRFSRMFDPDLSNLYGFFQYAIYKVEMSKNDILSTIIHDLNLINDRFPETCSPRSSSYGDK